MAKRKAEQAEAVLQKKKQKTSQAPSKTQPKQDNKQPAEQQPACNGKGTEQKHLSKDKQRKKEKEKGKGKEKEEHKSKTKPQNNGNANGHAEHARRDKSDSSNQSNIWWHRCKRLLINCVEHDVYEVVGKSLITWEPEAVLAMMSEYPAYIFAAVFAEWPADKLAALLMLCTTPFIIQACQSWPEDQLASVLPKLRTKVIRQVLRELYFESSDRYLTALNVRDILMAMPEKKRKKLTKKIKDKDAVQRVLEADSDDADSLGAQDDVVSDGDDDSYDDSFICDDEDEDGEGEDEAANGNKSDSHGDSELEDW